MPLFKKRTTMPDERRQLIHDEMQFLLEKNPTRFTRQLRARLLEEGCNLPIVLARPIFYQHMQTPLDADIRDHPSFYGAVYRFWRRVATPEPELIQAEFAAIDAICAAWRIDKSILTRQMTVFDDFLRRAIARMRHADPDGRIGRLPAQTIAKRVMMALITALLTHTRRPDAFNDAYGNLPKALNRIHHDPAQFCRAMNLLWDQTAYSPHMAAQSFWRVIDNLNIQGAGSGQNQNPLMSGAGSNKSRNW